MSNWVLLRGAGIDTKPEQRVKDTIEVIENESQLEGIMFTKPLEVTSTALVKITTESLEGSDLHRLVHRVDDPPVVALSSLDPERLERRLELRLELVEMLAHGLQLLRVGRVIDVRGVPIRVADHPLSSVITASSPSPPSREARLMLKMPALGAT
jgi:hypothetical protein